MIPVFFNENLSLLSSASLPFDFEIEGEEFHHLVKVLRLKVGKALWGTSGNGYIVQGEIHGIAKDKLILRIASVHYHPPLAPIQVYLGMTQKDAFETALTICQEYQVHTLHPLICDYSTSGDRLPCNHERIQRLLHAAIKQSRGAYLTQVGHPCRKIEDIPKTDNEVKWVAHPYSTCKQDLDLNHLRFSKSTLPLSIFVGPEGGFSPREIKYMESHWKESPCYFIQMGRGILRTPTALAGILGVASTYFLGHANN